MIDIFIKAFLDDSALLDGKWRLLNNGLIYQLVNVGQRIQLIHKSMKFFIILYIQKRSYNCRNHFDGIPECKKVSGISCFEDDLGHKSLKIIDWAQILSDLLPCNYVLKKSLNRTLSLNYKLLINKRLLYEGP